MTQSDNIVEFLKYASPRLDYIEHCMEKQALSPGLTLRAVQGFRSVHPRKLFKLPNGKIKNRSAKFQRIANLSKSLGNRKDQLAYFKNTFNNRYSGYVKGDSGRVLDKAYFDQYGRLPDNWIPITRHPKVTAATGATAGAKGAKGARGARGARGSAKAPTAGANGANGAAGANGANEAAAGVNEAAKTVGSSVGSWMGRHPYLTIGAGVGLGAGGAAVGYNSGESTGREEAAKAMQLYYAMRESMQRQNLQSANSSFLSRLANLFGTGELSNMIG